MRWLTWVSWSWSRPRKKRISTPGYSLILTLQVLLNRKQIRPAGVSPMTRSKLSAELDLTKSRLVFRFRFLRKRERERQTETERSPELATTKVIEIVKTLWINRQCWDLTGLWPWPGSWRGRRTRRWGGWWWCWWRGSPGTDLAWAPPGLSSSPASQNCLRALVRCCRAPPGVGAWVYITTRNPSPS